MPSSIALPKSQKLRADNVGAPSDRTAVIFGDTKAAFARFITEAVGAVVFFTNGRLPVALAILVVITVYVVARSDVVVCVAAEPLRSGVTSSQSRKPAHENQT